MAKKSYHQKVRHWWRRLSPDVKNIAIVLVAGVLCAQLFVLAVGRRYFTFDLPVERLEKKK
jgi:hypothetical protein